MKRFETGNNGNGYRFEDIWDEYYPKLTIYLQTTFKINDTEDLVQDIMLKLHRNLHKYRPAWSLNTWIYSIAHNHAIDFLKKKTNLQKLTETAKNQAEIADNNYMDPENCVIEQEIRDDISFFIEGLPDAERNISFLKYYENLGYKEISRIMNIPVGTIKYHVHNVKKKFEAYYGERYEI